MRLPAAISADVLDKVLAFLVPLFLDPLSPDPLLARRIAWQTLSGYGVRTNRELRLAALAVAFGFRALEALGKAADPALTTNQSLRLQGNANALNRAATQNETRLEKLLRAPPVEDDLEDDAEAPGLPDGAEADDMIAFVRTEAAARKANVPDAGAGEAAVAAPAAVSADPTGDMPRPDMPVAAAVSGSAAARVISGAPPVSRQVRRAAERQARKQLRRQQQAELLAERAARRDASRLVLSPSG